MNAVTLVDAFRNVLASLIGAAPRAVEARRLRIRFHWLSRRSVQCRIDEGGARSFTARGSTTTAALTAAWRKRQWP